MAASVFAVPTGENYSTFSFTNSFRGVINETWKTTENILKASFVFSRVRKEAFCNREENILASSKVISPAVLPGNAEKTVATKYCDYTMKESVNIMGAEHSAADYLSMDNRTETVI